MARSYTSTGEETPEFVPDQRVHRTSSGAQLVHLYQHYRGVPVFESVRTVLFDAEGQPLEIVGSHTPTPHDADLLPTLEPVDAVSTVVEAIRQELGADHKPRISSRPARLAGSFPLPSRPSVFVKSPFEGLIAAHMVFFYRGGDMPLGWFIRLKTFAPVNSVHAIVGAIGNEAGTVLFRKSANAVARGRGLVHLSNPGAGHRTRRDFPEDLEGLPRQRPADLAPTFPGDWIGSRRTLGNNVDARRKKKSLEGSISGGDVVFEPSQPQGNQQRILDAFYFCNLMHDFFFLLGFDERERNFQTANMTAAPGAGDEMEVRIFTSSFPGFASTDVDVDGRNCRISLGPVPPANLHTALDADVVMHEYTHGVTARIIGGEHLWRPLFGPPQARALDEGYCDYFALTFQAYRRARELIADGASMGEIADGERHMVFGAWVANDAVRGLRDHAYGDDFSATFGDLATAEFDPHDAGQIWGEALLRVNRKLGDLFQDRLRGHELGWQLVVDSMKLLPVNTNVIGFLQARDRLVRAADLLAASSPQMASGEPLLPPGQHLGVLAAIWSAFAELGMGPAAASEGASLEGILEDFAAESHS